LRKLTKSQEPKELSNWKKRNSGKRYNDIDATVRLAVRKNNIRDQLGLCAYCCKRIDMNNSMNEHVEAKSLAHEKELDFSNIVASCTTPRQCDRAHKAQPLPLTPLMDECETELKFYLSGMVKGLTDRAEQSIKVLNLNQKGLKACRKQVVDALLYEHGSSPKGVALLDDELISIVLDKLKIPDKDGLLSPYSPVLVNILGHYV